MKRIAIFVGLKIAEISAIIFIPYFIGVLDKNTVRWAFFDWKVMSVFDLWMAGFQYFAALLMGIAAIGLIYLAVYANWQWAKKLNPTKPGK